MPSPQKEHVMDSQKNDLRVRMTKKRLRKAFAQMMLERPLQNISVAELCIKAEINRSTFYAHYADIFDLQQRLEEEIYLEFQETLSHVNLPNALSVDKVPLFMSQRVTTTYMPTKKRQSLINQFMSMGVSAAQ